MEESTKKFVATLYECAAACDSCMEACLEENDVKKMVTCIRTDRDCAAITRLTASLVASDSPFAASLVRECEKVCNTCRKECAKHDTDHCQACATACRECAEACGEYLNVAA